MQIHRYTHDFVNGDSWLQTAISSTQGERPTEWTWKTLPLYISNLVDPSDDVRHVSNVVRYALLYHFGGLWLDNDVIPLVNLSAAEPYTAALFDQREGCVLWFPKPGHPFLRAVLCESLRGDSTLPSSRRSGAHVLTSMQTSEVMKRRDVLPFDARGMRVSRRAPAAIHVWASRSNHG